MTDSQAPVTLGFCSISALDRPLAAAAAVAADAGLAGLEITARPPHLDPTAPPEEIARAGETVRAAGLDIVAYGSYLGRDGARSAEEARREVSVAAMLGSPLVRVWAEPDPDPNAPEQGFAGTVAWLRAACDEAAERGITVVVERHLGSFADTPQRIDRLFDAVDRPALALNYQVLDFLALSEVDSLPSDARRLAPIARYVHLKNYRRGDGGADRLLPGGSLARGALDVSGEIAAILETGYAGPMTIEFLSFEPLPLEEKLAADVAFVRGVLADLGRQ